MIEDNRICRAADLLVFFVGIGFVGIDDARICMRDKSNQ